MQELKIKITTDANGAINAIEQTKSDLNDLQDKSEKAGGSFANLKDKIAMSAHSVIIFTGAVAPLISLFSGFLKKAVGLNAGLEDLQVKLQGLIAANSANVTSTGRVIDATQKWTLSGQEAAAQLERLKDMANVTKTPINDLANGFTMFYASASNQGGIASASAAFESIANAAKVAGKDMNALVPMFDSLANGTVVAGSEMGSFMRIVGLTNEELKKAYDNGQVFDYINDKLAKFKELSAMSGGTYNNVLADLKMQFEDLQQELGKPLFESLKAGLTDLNAFIRENKAEIINFTNAVINAGKHLAILGGAFAALKISAAAFNGVVNVSKSALLTYTSITSGAVKGTGALRAALNLTKLAFKSFLPIAIVSAAIEAFISLTGKAVSAADALSNAIARTNAEIAAMTVNQKKAETLKLNEAYAQNSAQMSELRAKLGSGGKFFGLVNYSEDEKTKMKAQLDDLRAQNKEILSQKKRLENETLKDKSEKLVSATKLNAKSNEKQSKDLSNNLSKQEAEWQKYFNTIGDKSAEWAVNEKRRRDELFAIGFKADDVNKIISAEKTKFFKVNSEIKTHIAKSGGIGKSIKTTIGDTLDREIEYYKAVGDLQQQRIKEKEKETLRLKELGLNNLQIQEYFAKEQTKIENEERLKRLQDEERYYELLGEKTKAANIRAQINAENMRNEGNYTDGQIANANFGEEQKKSNYDALNSAMGYDSGIMGQFQNRMSAIDDFYNAEIARIEAYYAQIGDIEGAAEAKRTELMRAQMQARMSEAGAGFDALGGLFKAFYDASGGENKKALRAYQIMMVGKAIVNTYTAASNAYASAGNPYLGAALAALAIAQGMAQVAQIKAQKFHTGGSVGGDLKADEVNAVLLKGEYVLNREQTKQLKENSATASQNSESGGITIVNTVDPHLFETWAESRSGRKIIKNIVGA